MVNLKPKILLIGVGHFGQHHLRILNDLHTKGEIELVGAVVRTEKSKQEILKKYTIPVYTEIPRELLAKIDAVDIATPPETHFALVSQCLPHANVLVEKPLAMSETEASQLEKLAAQHNRILMVGHIFRFNPIVKKLKTLFDADKNKPNRVIGHFTNPTSTDPGWDPSLDILHYYDILDFLFDKKPELIQSEQRGRALMASLRYPNMDASFTLGWENDTRIRTLDFYSQDKIIKCDFLANTIDTFVDGKNERQAITSETDSLTEEIKTFVGLLKGAQTSYTTGKTASRIVGIAEQAQAKQKNTDRPKVAIIGAGIFGTSCAIELGKFADVTVFERNSDILSEASFVNQYRHHWGYHYPRSSETVQDITEATGDFEKLYSGAIIRDFPTYYGVAREGSKVNGADYIKFCEQHKLPFTLEYPDDKFLDKAKIEVCLKTLEPIYNYERLKTLVSGYLALNPNIHVQFNTRVLNAELATGGKKVLTVDRNGVTGREEFDYVINVTYANFNQFAHWLGFPKKPIRLDVVEALIVQLPIPRISLAVMDGPFTNLVPTGQDHIFTLVHIKESILKRFVPSDGLVPPGLKMESNAKNIIEKSKEWFPILSEAKLLESRYIYRSVNAYREHDDARPSDIVNHGFGCFSILGGKILNCVTAAKKIATDIGHTKYTSLGQEHRPHLR